MLINDCFKGPIELGTELDLGRWLILVARNSGSGGRKAREYAADEVLKTAEGLRDKIGIDITSELPTKSQIIAGLENATAVKSIATDGRSFTNEYLTITLSSIKTIIFVSTGSGRKLDDQFEQPFLQELIALVKSRKPALVFANRIDRIFRQMLAGAELLKVLEVTGGLLGDSEAGIRSANSVMQVMTLVEAMGSEKEAAATPKKTRAGMVSKTELLMKNGGLKYAVMNQPPAGTIRMTLKSNKGTKGEKMLFLDDPACFPKTSNVAFGIPTALGVGKKSNVALVQWALANLGKPGTLSTPEMTKAVVGEYLANEGFSSPGMRNVNGIDACFQPAQISARKYLPVRSILANLDFYQTGILKIRLGVKGVNNFEITGCMPLSGQWASPSDFERIKKYLGENVGGGPGVQSLVGVSVKTNGGLCRLASAQGKSHPEGPAYVLRKIDKGQRRKGFPALPHDVLAESIIVGLEKAAQSLWIPIESQADQCNPGLQVEIAKARKEIESLERQCKGLLNQIGESDDLGLPLLDPGTRRALGKSREEILTQQLEPARQKFANLEHDLFSEMQKLSQQSEAAPANLLNELVASLKDSSNTTYNRMWKTCLSIETMTKDDSFSRGHAKSALRWDGTLRISSLSHSFEIPFSGTYVVGAITKVDARVGATIDLMGQGVPLASIEIPQMRALKASVAQELGIASRRFNLGSCVDPRILKIGVMIMNEPKLSDGQLGDRLKEPELLIKRVRESFAKQPYGCRWVSSRSITKSNWFDVASNNDGVVTQSKLLKLGSSNWVDNLCKMRRWALSKDDWSPMEGMSAQLSPCAFCGSHRRSASRLFEPVGLVCLDCHLDQEGLLWPSDPYDQWLHYGPM